MKNAPLLLAPLGLAALAACSPGRYASNETEPAVYTSSMGGTVAATSSTDLRIGMRKLWEDHVLWTRNFIISAAGGLPDLQPVTERLLRNQTDIGNAVKPFYGDAAGNDLTTLLRGHITTAASLVNAAKAGNNDHVAEANRRWQANADSIATFLHNANPQNWPLGALREEMRTHLDLTLREAQARLRGDWAADIAAYDAVRDHVLRMADMLADGISRQHPQRVSSSATMHPDHRRDSRPR